MKNAICRLPVVLKMTCLSRSTIYKRVEDGRFPPPISLGDRAIGWLLHEVQVVILALIAGKTNEEIETLVTDLVAQRNDILEGAMLCNQ